jgi:Ca2+-binding RTX toxin-like protein
LDDDALVGGAGADTADYSTEADDVAADLESGFATGDSIGTDLLAGIENLTGGSGNDTLSGDEFINVIYGGDGDDALYGDEIQDILDGEGGTNTINGV